MQTLSEFAERTSNGDPFFASIAKRDNATYISRFGEVGDNIGNAIGNKNKIINKLNKSSKIASVKNSQKVFDDLYSNDTKFKELVDFRISKGGSKSGICADRLFLCGWLLYFSRKPVCRDGEYQRHLRKRRKAAETKG